jgi:hypothetical protein
MAVLSEHPELKASSVDNHWIDIVAQAGDVPALVRALVGADIDVYQVQVRQKTLEALFLELTNEPLAGPPANVPALQGEVL